MTNAELFNLYHQIKHSWTLVRNEIAKRNIDWRHLVEEGLIIEAIVQLRASEPTLGLKEAKDRIDAYRAS